MIHVSEPHTTTPSEYKTELQEKTYAVLEQLHIPFQRVDTDEVITMEDCAAINQRLDMQMVKTLFLCDRKQQAFTLFITAGDKPFRAKEFANALGVSRLSFAPAGKMEEMLGTKIGAATIFSALLPSAKTVNIIIDEDVAAQEWYGCSDGTTTGYMKIRTKHILGDFMKHTGKKTTTIKV